MELLLNLSLFPFTRYGRHTQYVSDAPWLYKYIRENFYYVIRNGDSDLISEFIDILRTYGCNESTDIMVRQGSRYMISEFIQNGRKWITNEEKGDDYTIIHGPWTAISGVMSSTHAEPMTPGSYGYEFRKAMERGEQKRKNRLATTES